MSIDNPPVFSEPPEEPIIGTPADTFEPLYQSKMHYQLVTEPAERQAHVAWLQAAYNSIGAELKAKAAAEFASLDQLDNEGLINALIEVSLTKVIPKNHIDGRFTASPYPQNISTAIPFVNEARMFGSYNGSTLTHGGSFIDNSITFGGSNAVLPAHVEAIINEFDVDQAVKARGGTWNTLKVTAGSGTAVAPQTNLAGNPCYLASFSNESFAGSLFTRGFWMVAEGADAVVFGRGKNSLAELINLPQGQPVYVVYHSPLYPFGLNEYPFFYLERNVGSVYIAHPYFSNGWVDLQPSISPYL